MSAMPLDEQVVSLDLARQLREAGVMQDSQFYWLTTDDGPQVWYCERQCGDEETTYAAFTVAELGELLPRCYMSWSTPQTGELRWWCRVNEQHMVFHDRNRPTFTAAKEADARAKMLMHLASEA